MYKFSKKEDGEVMIESLIVYLVTFTLLFLVLALMMLTYQRFTIKTVAVDMSVKIAQNIRYSDIDIEDGVYTENDIKTLKPYRYLFGGTASMQSKMLKSGGDYTISRLMKTTFKGVVTKENTTIKVEVFSDGPALRHVTVTVKGQYKLPFDEMLDFFNLSHLKTFEFTESAECVDILDYINYVDFSKNLVNIVWGDLGKSGKLIDKIVTLVNKFINYN